MKHTGILLSLTLLLPLIASADTESEVREAAPIRSAESLLKATHAAELLVARGQALLRAHGFELEHEFHDIIVRAIQETREHHLEARNGILLSCNGFRATLGAHGPIRPRGTPFQSANWRSGVDVV